MLRYSPIMEESPTFARYLLGQQLRALRDAADVRVERAGKAIDSSHSTISRIELGKTGIKLPSLERLLDLYKVTDEAQRETLASLAAQGKAHSWWARFGGADVGLPDTYRNYVGLESSATEMRNYEALILPGLLQTEAYARALMMAADSDKSIDYIEQRVKIRLQRQGRLTDRDPLRLTAVLDEAAVRRAIGGKDVMIDQLDHLIEISRRRNVVIQVLPFDGGAYAGMIQSFVILNFPGLTSKVVYAEGLTSDLYVEGSEVERYSLVYENLRGAALRPVDSVRLMTDIRRELAKT